MARKLERMAWRKFPIYLERTWKSEVMGRVGINQDDDDRPKEKKKNIQELASQAKCFEAEESIRIYSINDQSIARIINVLHDESTTDD